MDAMLGGMTWEEEYNLLTKFHENNVGPAGNKDVLRDGEKIKKTALDDALAPAPVGGGKAKSLGRGSKVSTHDESFIGGNNLGTAHRDSLLITKAESVFSRKTPTKNESDAYSGKESPIIASTPNKKEVQRITIKPKLVNRKSSSSGGTSDSPIPTHEKSMGRGRGLKSRLATAEFPVGVVANMIEKNIGQGHRAGYDYSTMIHEMPSNKSINNNRNNNRNNNNATYFPKFDYGQVSIGRGTSWWAAPKTVENRNLEKSKAKVGTELDNNKIDKLGKVQVERAILSKWTPLDDSV